MRITLIKPNIGMLQLKKNKVVPFNDRGRMEPLQMGVLAALTPLEHEIIFYDDRVNRINFDEPTDLVAINVEIYMAKRSYEIAAEYRKRKVPVVLGGIHASLMPEEAASYSDSVVIGDAENAWEELLSDFEKGQLKKTYYSSPSSPHPGKMVRHSIYKGNRYLPLTLLQYGRGCPFTCSFCSICIYFKNKVYYRDVEEVIAEIKERGRKFLFFVDDNITGDKEKAKKLFRALIPLKVKWVGQASLNMTEDQELMDLLQKSGCIGLVVGFESFTEEGLSEYNKTPNKQRDYEQQIKILNDHRISIWAAFVLGHDQETPETLKQTLQFTIKQKFAFAAFNILMPYPGTQMYKKLKEEKRLLFDDKWWLHPDYRFNHAAFIPRNMSADELTRYAFHMRSKFNSIPVILGRIMAWHNFRNVGRVFFMLRMMLLFRSETFRKQGMKFGFR